MKRGRAICNSSRFANQALLYIVNAIGCLWHRFTHQMHNWLFTSLQCRYLLATSGQWPMPLACDLPMGKVCTQKSKPLCIQHDSWCCSPGSGTPHPHAGFCCWYWLSTSTSLRPVVYNATQSIWPENWFQDGCPPTYSFCEVGLAPALVYGAGMNFLPTRLPLM